MTHKVFTTPQNRKLAFRKYEGAPGKPTFVWLSGFMSDMEGSKVTALEAWARAQNISFIAFDYSGHGKSEGAFEEGTIGRWREDTLAIIDGLTDCPLILVGSSMGGWQALLAAMVRPERVAGLVLIAPAPDFTQKLMWPDFSPEAQKQIMEEGLYLQPSDYDAPYPITRELIEDGKTWQILDAPIAFSGPVRILQGRLDTSVPWQHAQRLVETLATEDLVFTLVKDGDHSLSREPDIERLLMTCDEISGKV